MEWTVDHKKFIRQVQSRFKGRTSPQHMHFMLKRHMNVDVSVDELTQLMKELAPTPPPAVLVPIPVQKKQRDMKSVCIDIINEARSLLAEAGVHKVSATSTLDGLTPVLFLSDLHFGEKTLWNGGTIFDLEIAKTGFCNIVDQFISAPELDGYSVDECVVLIGGDIIDGELIYPAQAYDTEGHAFEQIKEATTIIWAALERLASKFTTVRVYCVPGNHGRTSKLHHQMSNWDNVLYYGLQIAANMKAGNIEVTTPSQMWMDFKIRGWMTHFRHIGVTQAVTAGPAKKVLTWMENHNADLFFFGHFHSPEMYSMGHRRIFKNGALPPANDFAENLGFQDGSGQWMIGVTDRNSVAFSKVLIP